MKIMLNRILLGTVATIGEMSIDNEYLCDTLEDRVRPTGEKVYGETAIPAGTYEVKLTHSPRFKKVLPEILNVPNFTGIRIHSGNDSSDSSGCVLVGTWDGKKENWISDSRAAFNKLMDKLQAATDKKENITITIVNNYEEK